MWVALTGGSCSKNVRGAGAHGPRLDLRVRDRRASEELDALEQLILVRPITGIALGARDLVHDVLSGDDAAEDRVTVVQMRRARHAR
jgi:hypothetical protein